MVDRPYNWPRSLGSYGPPEKDYEVEPIIGRFVVAWGSLERELDLYFPVLFRVDATLAMCIYANLGTKAKLDIISSALSMLSPALKETTVMGARKLIAKVRDLAGSARNTLAHGQPWEFSPQEIWWITRVSAHSTLDVAVYPTDETYWNRQIKSTYSCARGLRRYLNQILKSLSQVTDAQLDDICVFQLRVVERVSGRSRSRHTQRIDAFLDRPAKQGRRVLSPAPEGKK